MPSWWDWSAAGAIGQWLGAIATFAAVVVALRAEWRARDTRLVVKVALGPTAGGRGGPTFIVSVVNRSNRTVILDGGGILLADHRQLGPITTPVFTGDIRELERKEDRILAATVAQWLNNVGITKSIRLWFYIQDSTGKQHGCKHTFDPHPWIRKSCPSPSAAPAVG
jgi:hypothetical protein